MWVCGRVAKGNHQGMGDRGAGRHEPCQHFSLTLGLESVQTLPPEATATDITGLRPGTSYQVAVSALRGREEGLPAVIVARTGQGLTTCPLAPHLQGPFRPSCLPSHCFSAELLFPFRSALPPPLEALLPPSVSLASS